MVKFNFYFYWVFFCKRIYLLVIIATWIMCSAMDPSHTPDYHSLDYYQELNKVQENTQIKELSFINYIRSTNYIFTVLYNHQLNNYRFVICPNKAHKQRMCSNVFYDHDYSPLYLTASDIDQLKNAAYVDNIGEYDFNQYVDDYVQALSTKSSLRFDKKIIIGWLLGSIIACVMVFYQKIPLSARVFRMILPTLSLLASFRAVFDYNGFYGKNIDELSLFYKSDLFSNTLTVDGIKSFYSLVNDYDHLQNIHSYDVIIDDQDLEKIINTIAKILVDRSILDQTQLKFIGDKPLIESLKLVSFSEDN